MASEAEFWGRDADACAAQIAATRARVVREALRSLANEPCAGHLFMAISQEADNAALVKLGRLLK